MLTCLGFRREGSRQRTLFIVAALSASLAIGASFADGPGMLLYTAPPAGVEVHRAPFRPYRAIGRAPQLDPAPVLPLITANGRVEVLAAEGSPLLAIPDSIVVPQQVVYTPLGFCMARGESGSLWVWGSVLPAWMPGEPMRSIDAGRTAVGGITMDGSLRVWNLDGELDLKGGVASPRALSLGVGWGAVISEDGELGLFGFGTEADVPALGAVVRLTAISVDGDAANARAVGIDASGGLRSFTGSLEAPGTYDKVAIGTTRLVALETSGSAKAWDWNAAAGGWVAGQSLPGVFSDVGVAGVQTYLTVDPDANRDGVADSTQAIAGQIPDLNGDLLDDRRQSPTVLLDENGNGVLDVAESPGAGERRRSPSSLWYMGGYSPYTICFAALARVPVAAENLRRVILRHSSDLPAKGLEAEFAIWVDPSGDGDPEDVVLARAFPVTLLPSGRTVIDLAGVSPGPPGTVFFQSLTYVQPLPHRPALFPASVPANPSGFIDPLRNARRRARSWAMAWMGDELPATRTEQVRTLRSYDQGGTYGVVPNWTAVWGDRDPADCDGDGVLDSMVTGTSAFVWGPDVDVDNDGFVDACEEDCDGDGLNDVAEILAGASDCDLNLVPDACEPTGVERSIDAAAPAANGPVELAFIDVPPAIGDVTVTIEVIADLGAPTEFLVFEFPGLPDSALFATTGRDCPETNDVAVRVVPFEAFNAARKDGDLRLAISASTFVSAAECPSAGMRVSLAYPDDVVDCDGDGAPDACGHGWARDCNGDGVPDECQLADPAFDVDGNGELDACEFDCDGDGLVDRIEILADPTLDCDGTGFLDPCEIVDCNRNGIHDPCELLDPSNDCNHDGVLDECQEIADCNGDGLPDACQSLSDCDGDGQTDTCEIADGAADKDGDAVPDACEYARGDFDLDGGVGPTDLAFLLAAWGVTGLEIGDLDGDGTIAAGDLSILLANWGPTS